MKKFVYPWQAALWERMIATLTAKRLPHALLCHGQAKIGKICFVRQFAKRIYCHQPINEQPCNACKSCHLFQQESHPDYVHVKPEGAAEVIKVDQIREVSRKLQQTSAVGSYKIVLIEQAHAMNVAASNALLKTLEEPTGESLIVLTTNRVDALLPTILSRCQLLEFPVPEKAEVVSWLSAEFPGAAVDKAVEVALGAPLLAQQILAEDRLKDYQVIVDDLSLLLAGKKSAIVIADEWQKKSLGELTDFLYVWCADLLKLVSGVASDMVSLTSLNSHYQKLLPILSKQKLIELSKRITQMKIELGSSMNLNKQMMLEEVLALSGDTAS